MTSPDTKSPHQDWKSFASLPDSVGFGGMFAGVIDGQLFAGGGSQFSLLPPWLGGEKSFSDRIFTLGSPSGEWTLHSTRLPEPIAHFACATTPDAIYLAGGMGPQRLSAQAFEIRADSSNSICVRQLPPLPRPVAYAAGVIVNGRLYIAGGQHDTTIRAATCETWSLGLDAPPNAGAPTWRREPDLPGSGVFVGAMAAFDGAAYFIGGTRYDETSKSIPSARVFRLRADAHDWEHLPDMPAPRVGPASPCPVADGRLLVIGGYANVFAGERREHPGFDRQTFAFDFASQRWTPGHLLPHTGPVNKDSPGDPGPSPMVAAPAVIWQNHIIVVSGEVRAGVRSPAVLALSLAAS